MLAGKVDSGMSSDTYSYGILINEMASRRRPWAQLPADGARTFQRAFAVAREVRDGKRPQLAEDLDPAFLKLLQECWAQDPEERPAFGPHTDKTSVIARIRKLAAFKRVSVAVPADGTPVAEPEPPPALSGR